MSTANAERFADRLAALGFASYAAYLNSALWAGIRARVYGTKGRICIRCKCHAATQIHHVNYEPDTLSGRSIIGLVPICRPCHRKEHGLSEPEATLEPSPVAVIRIPWDGNTNTRQGGKTRGKESKKRKRRLAAAKRSRASKKQRRNGRTLNKIVKAGCNPRAFGIKVSETELAAARSQTA
jgi:hypothetical protein